MSLPRRKFPLITNTSVDAASYFAGTWLQGGMRGHSLIELEMSFGTTATAYVVYSTTQGTGGIFATTALNSSTAIPANQLYNLSHHAHATSIYWNYQLSATTTVKLFTTTELGIW